MCGAPSWEQDRGMFGISTGTPDHVQKPDRAGISLAGFQTKMAVFEEVSSLLCSVTVWAVMLQCRLTNNSMSYFSQGLQSSWVQDLKECHAVGADLTGTERNRKKMAVCIWNN